MRCIKFIDELFMSIKQWLSKLFFPQRLDLKRVNLKKAALNPLLFSILTMNFPFGNTEPFEFALIGDLPYGVSPNEISEETQRLIKNLNNESSLAWVIHVGDIKRGGASCSDEFLRDRHKRFSRLAHHFILTPGDNEWTDCHSVFAGGYDPLERLNYLRDLFFKDKKTRNMQKELNIATQPKVQKQHKDYVENYFWKKNNVHFATIHIVGSKDGTKPISKFNNKISRKQQKAKTQERQRAAIDWLNWVFRTAQHSDARGLFIAIHGNPGWDLRWQDEDRPAYKFFTKALEKNLKRFQAPVVLAHGDTHTFRIDKPDPLYKRASPSNFTRVETFGENNNAWIRVRVDPNSRAVFSYEIHDGE